MSQDEPGPKEAALREMREARLKQVMAKDEGKKIAYPGRDSDKVVRPRPKAKGYGPATREAKPPPGKRRKKKGAE